MLIEHRRKNFLRAACASNFENGSFHPQKSAFSNHRDILETTYLPSLRGLPQTTACLAALPLDFALHALPRPISASLAAPPHSANADAITRRARFFEETSNIVKTIYPFILSLNRNIKYHYSAMPERQRPLAQTSPSRRRIATMYRVLSPWSSCDRSLSASAYHNFTSTYATYRRGNPRILSIVLTTPCAWLII